MKLKHIIMVVDDEPHIGKMLTQFLARHNYQVIFFTRGKEALAYLKDFPGDLLLTDLQMPNLTGIELAREVKTLYPALPIIVMSGSADGPARDEIFSIPADFIPKPFGLADLLERINSQITINHNQPGGGAVRP